MKPLPAALAIVTLCFFTGGFTRGHALETEPTLEDPAATPPERPKQDKQSKFPQGALTCTLEDQTSTEVHVLLCQFENSETCVLANTTPLRALMQRYDGVKILMIGSTPEGCSKLTFTGSLKTH